MDIFDLLKMMSSKSKAKIIVLFYTCKCNDFTVLDLCHEFKLQQANTSKHLSALKNAGVLDFVKHGKKVFYKINDDFKKQWGDLIAMLIASDSTLQECSAKCIDCINHI